MRQIRPITLPLVAFEPLLAEARAGPVPFIEMTAKNWLEGTSRFDGRGEVLCGCFEEEQLIAVGGLTADPYVRRADVGRLRRIYVRPAWRRQGVARSMVMHLLGEARSTFQEVRLRADTHHAAQLYEQLGFAPILDADATHGLRFEF